MKCNLGPRLNWVFPRPGSWTVPAPSTFLAPSSYRAYRNCGYSIGRHIKSLALGAPTQAVAFRAGEARNSF
jgi:hypothetical protein